MNAESPPDLGVDREVSFAPIIQRDVDEEGGEEGQPDPEVLAPEPLACILSTDPAPELPPRCISFSSSCKRGTWLLTGVGAS